MTLEAILLALQAVELPAGVTSRLDPHVKGLTAESIDDVPDEVALTVVRPVEGCLERAPGDSLDSFCGEIRLVVQPQAGGTCQVVWAAVRAEFQWWQWDAPRSSRRTWNAALLSLGMFYVERLASTYDARSGKRIVTAYC